MRELKQNEFVEKRKKTSIAKGGWERRKKKKAKEHEMPTARIELTTSSLLVMRSTTEPCGLCDSLLKGMGGESVISEQVVANNPPSNYL